MSVRLRLLGGFHVDAGNADVTSTLAHSPKGVQLMQYLILNRGHMETTQALTRAMWPDTEASRPESALKTLISRFRTLLMQVSPALSACLKTVRGGYQWETQPGISVDVEEYLQLAEGLRGRIDMSDDAQGRSFRRLMEVYTGRLLCEQEQPDWMKNRADTLHQLYLDVVEECLQKLQDAQRQEEVVSVCRQALDADPLNSSLNMRLMDALMHTGRESDAIRQYRYASEFNQGSDTPGAALDEYYTRMLQSERDLQRSLLELREELIRSQDPPGALLCDRIIFDEMFRLERRSLERTPGSTITLAVMMLHSQDQSPWHLDAAMTCLLDTMVHKLRRGDIITRLNATQAAMLLPHATDKDAGMIVDRLKRGFYLQFPSGCTLTCVFTPIVVGLQRKDRS